MVLTLASVASLLLVGTRLRARAVERGGPRAVGASPSALLVWNVTAEIYAAIGEHDFSALVERNLPEAARLGRPRRRRRARSRCSASR